MNRLSELRERIHLAWSKVTGRAWVPGWVTSPRVQTAGGVALNALTLTAMAYVFWILNSVFLYNGTGYDETFFVWGGWCIRRGLAPYRDFLELKPPVLFLTHAVAGLFGVSNFGFRVFFALFPLASLLSLQLMLLRRGVNRWLALATVVGITALFVNGAWHDNALSDSESIGLSYYLLGLSFCLWEGRHLKVTTAIGGFFLACAVMSKEPYLLVVAPTWLALFLMRTEPVTVGRKLFARYSLFGIGALALALSLYMIPTGAMKAYIQMVARYAAIHRDPKTSICAFYGNAEPRTVLGTLDIWGRVFVNDRVLGHLLPLGVPGLVMVYRRSKLLFGLALLICVAGLKASTVGNCPWRHYYTMAISGIAFALVAGVDTVSKALRSAGSSLGTSFGVAAVVVAGFHVSPDIARLRKEHHERATLGEPQDGLLKFIAENTTKTDRIFTSGNPMLYVQTDRLSAVRESSFGDELLASYPGKTDEEKLRPIFDELARNKPKVVFLDPEYEDKRVRFNKAMLMPFLDQFHYKKIGDRLYLRP